MQTATFDCNPAKADVEAEGAGAAATEAHRVEAAQLIEERRRPRAVARLPPAALGAATAVVVGGRALRGSERPCRVVSRRLGSGLEGGEGLERVAAEGSEVVVRIAALKREDCREAGDERRRRGPHDAAVRRVRLRR